MIDFVKIEIREPDIDKIKNNSLLHFIGETDEETYELLGNSVASFQGLKFEIKRNRYLTVKGSLHKYKNKGRHNADNFSIVQLHEVIDDINKKFDLDIQNQPIRNIEIGVNVVSPTLVRPLLNGLIHFKGKPFLDMPLANGQGKKVFLQHYQLKVYDKGAQYRKMGFSERLLRFEIKVKKMVMLKKIPIKTLSDVCAQSGLKACLDLLIKKWEELFLIDNTIDKNKLTQRELVTLGEIKDYDTLTNWSKQKRYEVTKWYRSLVATKSAKTQEEIKRRIEAMLNEMGLPINHSNNVLNQ